MRVLALDSAADVCAAAIVEGGVVLAERTDAVQHGQAARLSVLVADLLQRAPVGRIDLIAVTVGPGSFTGLRASLALAHGLGAGWACPVVGVSVVEAVVAAVSAGERPIWIAVRARVGRVFLAHDGEIGSHAVDDLPAIPSGAVLAGNAADAVADRLGQSGHEIDIDPARLPALVEVAAIGVARHRGALPSLAAQPLYIDAPQAVPQVT